ncbi:MAG: glycerophosphodiester phosphodiesterase family protein [Rhodoluna sp.]|nr:glycerophosphodiester phosphodiesterase family protein [Rhodoluna sp.]
MQEHEYFNVARPVVLAHRGGSAGTENTIETFNDAVRCGVFSIETDVRTTKDGVAILFHDADLKRVANIDKKVSQTTFVELEQINLVGGGKIQTLVQALTALPQTRFNLDIKDPESVQTAAAAIELTKSPNRVLVSSFSEKRRLATLKLLTQPVATSASATIVIEVWLMHVFRLPQAFLAKRLKGIGALQIPRSMYGIKLDSKRFIRKVRATNTEIHYWTINNPQEMLELTARGATGIVSDVSELAVQTLRKA